MRSIWANLLSGADSKRPYQKGPAVVIVWPGLSSEDRKTSGCGQGHGGSLFMSLMIDACSGLAVWGGLGWARKGRVQETQSLAPGTQTGREKSSGANQAAFHKWPGSPRSPWVSKRVGWRHCWRYS